MIKAYADPCWSADHYLLDHVSMYVHLLRADLALLVKSQLGCSSCILHVFKSQWAYISVSSTLRALMAL